RNVQRNCAPLHSITRAVTAKIASSLRCATTYCRARPEIVRCMSDDQAVLTERRERVLLITINRPDQRNAVNAAVAAGIAATMDQLDGEADLSLGVLTGAGKGFSAGMDLKAFV